ncbi:hypothetical protein [Actinorhabdospora filicis]|nr:hypothetical protein [Actinorhabdospora filicis]
MQGRSAMVYAEIETDEALRRDGGGGLDDWELLDVLMSLPLGEPVPVRVLTPEQRRALDRAPEWAVTRAGGEAVRWCRTPVKPVLAVSFSRRWDPGLRTAHVFSSVCAQAVVLPSEPGDPLVAIEADQYGVGLGVGQPGGPVRVIVPPEPFRGRRHSLARWWFAEHVYAQLSAQKRNAVEAESAAVERQRLNQRL